MQKYAQGRGGKRGGLKRIVGAIFEILVKRGLGRSIILLGLALGLMGAIGLLLAFVWYSRGLPDPDTILQREVKQSTKIFDRTGEHLLYEIAPDQKRTLVTLETIPDALELATIMAEDRKFYEHPGIDLYGIFRAFLNNLIHFDPTGQGGSTITQQFVKKAILNNEQTIARKIKEIMIAVALERKFSKDEILQMYLNEIPYGGTNYGVESAARAYFGKSVAEIDLAQAATLAAIPNRPTTLINNPELLKSRRDWILNSLEEEGFITEEELAGALAEDTAVRPSVGNIEAPHFVLWIKEVLEERYGAAAVETGGLKVITTLDYEKQVFAEKALDNGVEKFGESFGFHNGTLVAVNPKTGEILAMVGSPDWFDADHGGQINMALRPLQPGSSIKPIIYSALWEQGYTPSTLLWDVSTTFKTATGDYKPQNYDLKERGLMSMRRALQLSLNIPAVKGLYLLGVENALDYATRLGYSTLNDPSRVGLSLVLGGAEVIPLEHVMAYGVFANGGELRKAVSILRVEGAGGELLDEYEVNQNPPRRVISLELAATVSNVLSDNATRAELFGVNNYLNLGARPAGAKTGTTNNFRDAWAMGYTPSLAVGVWVGNASGEVMNTGADGSKIAAPIWREFMDKALEGTPIENFPEYVFVKSGKAIIDGEAPVTVAEIDTRSGLLASAETPEKYRAVQRCADYHSILHFVDRADPLGVAPKSPSESEPAYLDWELGVSDFIGRYNAGLEPGKEPLRSCILPTEVEKDHDERFIPVIEIISPSAGATVTEVVDFLYKIKGEQSFSRVEFWLDGRWWGSTNNDARAAMAWPSWALPAGGVVDNFTHTIVVKAFDEIDNVGIAEVEVKYSGVVTLAVTRIEIVNPFNEQTIGGVLADAGVGASGTGYQVAVEAVGEPLLNLVITVFNLWTSKFATDILIETPTAISSGHWETLERGEYILQAIGTTMGGVKIYSKPVKVLVE